MHKAEQGILLSGGQKQRIVIAHRLSTIEGCDVRYAVQEGGVLETN
jgi:ABC-type bacteriocin/lantibiotic exporter with double-glycine peptidase domain